jgi:hypothetical protein
MPLPLKEMFLARTRSLGKYTLFFRYCSSLLLSLVRSKINGSVRKKTLQFTISDSCSGIVITVILMANGFYLNMTAKPKNNTYFA